MKEFVEIVASIMTLLLIFLGMPAQIINTYQQKNTKSLSFIFFFTSFLSWITVAFHHWLTGSVYMALTFGFGGLVTSIVLIQFWIYKKNINPPIPIDAQEWQQVITDNLKQSAKEKNKSLNNNPDIHRWQDEGGK